QEELAVLSGVWKSYGGVPVLKAVDLTVRPGEIHALVGGNGAGKSTLVKILAGVIGPDGGTITVNGTSHHRLTPALAHSIGISLVPQEPQLFPHMTVLENIRISIGRPVTGDEVVEAFDSLGHAIANDRMAGTLSISDQQLVEIAKGMLRKSEILVVDEPTAALTEHEVERLFKLLRALAERGLGIVYISHRLHEISELCHRVSVLRDGAVVFEEAASLATPEQLVEYMIPGGTKREHTARQKGTSDSDGHAALELRSLTGPGFTDISLTVQPGEIVALAGPVGSGRTEVAEAILGVRSSVGEVLIGGEVYSDRSPRGSLQRRLALIPEDRQAHGVFLNASVTENVTASMLQRITRVAIPRRQEREIAGKWSGELHLSGATISDAVGRLSGGNQQKVVLGRNLAIEPGVLVLDEPSRGVDVGARSDLYRTIDELSQQGMAILLVSSDLEEVVLLADRVLVMRQGRIFSSLEGEDVDFEKIRAAAFTDKAA
ncbi:MAG: sugar ABC transporter ATP-binding protein, partial [Chloroflexota bacterium]|nr:sugar ABC transporter ATP-binding protein [Chloroflexota bacterium]